MKVILVLVLWGSIAHAAEWERLRSHPDAEGFAGCAAGVSHDVLLCAGGANFPDRKPWEGGTKRWSDAVYALPELTGKWQAVGRLPKAWGYGVSVAHGERVILAGGNNADGHFAEVIALEFTPKKLLIHTYPALPHPVANACGVLVMNTLYVIGGQEHATSTKALATVYTLDLATPKATWQQGPTLPRERMLSMATVCDGKVFVVGGVQLAAKDGIVKRTYLADAYRLDNTGWTRLADLPTPLAAAPPPVPRGPKKFSILGGDDGTQIDVQPTKHRGFRTAILHYDSTTNKWHSADTIPAPRVTVPCVPWQQSWIILSGEQRPGVRSPEVWRWQPLTKE